MQRQVIALSGIRDCGKTTTIRLAYRILQQEGEVVQPPNARAKKETTAILKIDGVKVGFTSIGDIHQVLDRNLTRLVEAGCTVIVCAAHTYGGTVEAVEHLAPPFEIDWIEKERDADHDEANQRIADEIVAKIREAVVAVAV